MKTNVAKRRLTIEERVQKAANEQCPDGFDMVIKSQNDWAAIAHCVNQGIDSYLEAFTRSTFDSSGHCTVHPDELHILVRRLGDVDGDELYPGWNYERENNPAENLRLDILTVLGIEE